MLVDEISIFFGGKNVSQHVKCQVVSFISLSDANVRALSAHVRNTEPSVCHAVRDKLRHANIFSTPKLFQSISYLFYITYNFIYLLR